MTPTTPPEVDEPVDTPVDTPDDTPDDTLPDDTPEVLRAGPFAIDEGGITAELDGSTLELVIPVTNEGRGPGKGTFVVTVRDLGGDEVAGATGVAEAKPGEGQVVAVVTGMPALESMAQQAEYIVDFGLTLDEAEVFGRRSLLMLTAKADLILLAPDGLMEGQETAVRAFLVHPFTGAPLAEEDVTLTVKKDDVEVDSLAATTDLHGNAVFVLPPLVEGSTTLSALVGGSQVEANVEVTRESKLLLTTDKPMYQPGQTMHLRALGLNRADLSPLAADEILFEVFDAKGNKVFKQLGDTNEFGVAWATFKLASQVHLGNFSVRATVGEVVSEKTIKVDRYALPKFEVSVGVDKTWYLAGMTVEGEVQADYFFGKPVAGGTVTVTPYKYEADWVPMVELVGKTNDDGFYHFEFELPDYVVGQPLDQGKGLLMLEVTVTDTADHEQAVAQQIIVAQDALDVVVIPESGEIVPGVENQLYLFVADPTGSSVGATAALTVDGGELADGDDSVQIPAQGPATVSVFPEGESLTLDVHAEDGWGNLTSKVFAFEIGQVDAAVLLRTDQALYQVGDPLVINAWATGVDKHLFLDIVRKNQTVLTETLVLEDGAAQLIVDLDPGMSEDLVVDAYVLASNGQFIRDTQVVYVQPASDLAVAVTTDKPQYEPGEVATVTFAVQDQEANPVQAALGIQIVDEAVFALSEMKPGLMELYFRLEEELAQPTYQIGQGLGFSFANLFAQGAAAEPGSEEADAVQATTKAAFAALEGSPLNQQQVSSWKNELALVDQILAPWFSELEDAIAGDLEAKLEAEDVWFDEACGKLSSWLAEPTYKDFWGQWLEITVSNNGWWDCSIALTSGGPDETLGTEDDWTGSLGLSDLSTGEWDEGAWPMAGGDVDDDADGWAEEGGPPAPNDPSGGGGGGKDDIKVRSWFPETLFVEPALITNVDGTATVEVPLADSITEWRMTTLGSSKMGHLGSRTDGIVVFQDFFVDIDFPKYLTQNDEVTFPVAIYNYMEEPQTITVELEGGDWFLLLGGTEHTVTLEAGEVSVVHFPVKVMTVGWHSLTVYGIGQGEAKDAVKRTVEVKPDGKAIVESVSARFDNDGETESADHVIEEIIFPYNAIPGSETVVAKVLPGLSTHVVEGMESMLKLPGG